LILIKRITIEVRRFKSSSDVYYILAFVSLFAISVLAAFITPLFPTPKAFRRAAKEAVITIGIAFAFLTTTNSIDLLEVLQSQDDQDNAKQLHHYGAHLFSF